MEGLKTFSEDREYFKYAELGLTTSSKDQFYLDNLHLTYWHADKRDEGPVEEGWGTVLSFSQTFDDKWLVFARGGYAHDGGSLLERSVSVGGGYAPAGIGAPGTGHLFGFGVNWGQPNDALFGANLKDQYAMEAYFRLQVSKEFSISPDVQLLMDPALNPDEDKVWIFGLKARISL